MFGKARKVNQNWDLSSIEISCTDFIDRVTLIIDLGKMSQQRFASMVKAELEDMVLNCNISPYEASKIGVSKEIISRILSGQVKPKREQVLLWILAFRTWYSSPLFLESCDKAGLSEEDRPKFTADDAVDLMHLAGFSTPDEVKKAVKTTHTQRKRFHPIPEGFNAANQRRSARNKLVPHQDEPKTDGNIEALPIDQYRIIS